jgi:16S rRNA (cytosine1402-N4)-methyltransferase
LEHKRRHHYSGKYPRRFEEKYKELNPEKYGDTIAHVIAKGNTPAGMHIPICVREILDFLDVRPGQTGLDCTLGYGGHSLELLKKLGDSGHLFGLDVDPIESVRTRDRLAAEGFGPDRFTLIQTNFANIDQVAASHGPFDFILADLGVSSMQIDNPARGFSYKTDGPLDLRLNPEAGQSAAQRLQEMDEAEIAGMLTENADEPYAAQIARAIVRARRGGRQIRTTADLRHIIEETLSFLPKQEQKEACKKSCTRTFQALRIDVNREYEVLYDLLRKLPEALAPGGRAAILTFHSGEDRLVKHVFREQKKQGLYSEVFKEVIRPSAEECRRNPRAHSAKLRRAIR